jgi:hypothetical protein
MWRCKRCTQEVDDDFEVCWNCEATRAVSVADVDDHPDKSLYEPLLTCVRCGSAITFLGCGSFRDESPWGAWSALKHVLANNNFDIFGCVDCGQVELFMPEIAAHRRPQ